MPITRTNIDNLIFTLNEIPSAFLVDQEHDPSMVKMGNQVNNINKHWVDFKFDIELYKIKELYQLHAKELVSNMLKNNFNIDYYFDEAKTSLKNLIKKFTTEKIGRAEVKIRTDFIVKYFSQDEDVFVEEINDEGYVFQSIRPKIIVLTPDKYSDIPAQSLEKISKYFTFQEKLIKDLLVKINTCCTREYKMNYQYKYFMFDYSKIGKGDRAEEYIIAFVEELIDKKYIAKESKKLIIDYFHNRPSNTKVRWLRSIRDLSYLITQLIEKEYIINPKRHRPYSIAYIFKNKNGKEFSIKTFDGVHDPKDPASIDMIIGILG
jgi:hypothetical protein